MHTAEVSSFLTRDFLGHQSKKKSQKGNLNNAWLQQADTRDADQVLLGYFTNEVKRVVSLVGGEYNPDLDLTTPPIFTAPSNSGRPLIALSLGHHHPGATRGRCAVQVHRANRQRVIYHQKIPGPEVRWSIFLT